MLESRIKGYEVAFISGFIAFGSTYFITKSFIAAITYAAFLWILSVVIFLCYYFEIADDYYRKVKIITHPEGNKLIKFAIIILAAIVFTLIPAASITVILFIISVFKLG
jgi:hypothetical protein